MRVLAEQFLVRQAAAMPGVPKVLLSPRGAPFSQARGRELAQGPGVVLVCGRFEGVDERVLKEVDLEVSVGDFVLTGGAGDDYIDAKVAYGVKKANIENAAAAEKSRVEAEEARQDEAERRFVRDDQHRLPGRKSIRAGYETLRSRRGPPSTRSSTLRRSSTRWCPSNRNGPPAPP